ncbi:MAG: PEP/pyruvate-binding domain-containing protein, partial [Armatimonadota bacterium]
MSFILTVADPVETLERLGGGKAANLARLGASGFRVPDWFCVTTGAFDEFLSRGGLRELVESARGRRLEELADFSKTVTERFDVTAMPQAVRGAILAGIERHGFAARFLAVRSSGTVEDSPE